MSFLTPSFLTISTLAIAVTIPLATFILRQNFIRAEKINNRVVRDFERMALDGWILVVNQFSPQCSDIICKMEKYKKAAKKQRRITLPVYNICHLRDEVTLRELIHNSLFEMQLFGGVACKRFTANQNSTLIPTLYNVNTQLTTYLPSEIHPGRIWRFIFVAEQNDRILKDSKHLSHLNVVTTDEEGEEEELVAKSSSSSSSSSEEEKEEKEKEEDVE
jgi:hypothetical protein